MPKATDLAKELAAKQAAKLKEEQKRESESSDSEAGLEEPSPTPDSGQSQQEVTAESVLSQLPNGPSVEEIQAWREAFSSVYVLPLGS